MERMLGLARLNRHAAPRFLAEPGLLWAALPKPAFENLFEPPGIIEPVGRRSSLAVLPRNMATVLELADAVLQVQATRFVRRAALSARAGGGCLPLRAD